MQFHLTQCRAKAHAVSCRSLTAEVQAQSQASRCDVGKLALEHVSL